jgi:protein-ribulosamine 3-kinase
VTAELLAAISAAITDASGLRFAATTAQAASGGSIHRSYVLDSTSRRYFVKTNSAAALPQFIAEAEGLSYLAATRSVRVPAVICHGTTADTAFLVLEHLALMPATTAGQIRLAQAITALHRANASEKNHGLAHDNFIGAIAQSNARCEDWITFFREQRLRFQLDLAAKNGHGQALKPGERLLENIGGLFGDYRPWPSLLHGDLWSGNAGELDGGEPVIFDPAVYFGDRESDLAMTELFGGFAPAFYAAYDAAWPREPGYASRRTLYQLYHVLNHLNLFGAAYLAQAQSMIAELNAELG